MYTVRRGMHGINHSWTVCTQFELLRNSRKGCGTVTVGSLHSWVSDVGCSDSIIRGLCTSACTSEAFIRGCQTWDVPIQSFVDYVCRHAVSSKCVWTRVPAEDRHFFRGLCASASSWVWVFVCGLGYLRRAATFFVDYVRRQAVGSGSSCVDPGTCGGPPLFKLSSKYQAGIFVGLATLQETYGSVLMVGEKEHVFYMSSTTFRYSMMWASPSAGSGWMWHFDGSRHE